MIKSFANWLVEGVTPEQADKEIAKMQKWADEKRIKFEMNEYGNDKQFTFTTAFNRWILNLEKSRTKGGQNSNYQQTYNSDRDNLKWYYTIPGKPSNSYDYRANVKAGNFNTLKGFMETALELEKTFEICSQFLSTLDLEFDASDIHGGISKKLVWSIQSKTDYSTGLRLPSSNRTVKLEFNQSEKSYVNNGWDVWFSPAQGDAKRNHVDISNGSLFLELYNALVECENDLDKDAEIVLNAIADKPFETVWNTIKGGNWKELVIPYRGRKLKKYGV